MFRAAQPGQRPSHLGLSWPHSEQAKVVRVGLVLTLAIAGIMACRSAAGQRRDGTHPQKWRADAARSDSTYRTLVSLCLPADLTNVVDRLLDRLNSFGNFDVFLYIQYVYFQAPLN